MTKAPRKTATRRPSGLPDFQRPPLYELVLSIQFARTQLRNVNVGKIWELFRKQYPKVEEQAPLPPAFEKYGLPLATFEPPQFTFSTTPDVLRYWFVSELGDELLQIQADRLVHNWRQITPGATYPRYEPLRAKFKKEAVQIQKYLKSQKLGSIEPNQCEVSYINHISLGSGVEPEDKLDQIFTIWHETYSDNYLKRVERGQFAVSYITFDDDGGPLGRLHVQVQPAVLRTTSERIIQLNLTVRGKPVEATIESAFQWLDKGRSIVVRAFAALTTKEMHELWGRTDG